MDKKQILLIVLSVLLILLVAYGALMTLKYREQSKLVCTTELLQSAAIEGAKYVTTSINNELIIMVESCRPLYVNTTTGIYAMSTEECFNKNK